MSNALLRADGVVKTYMMGRSPLRVLRGVSLEVTQGEFVAVMGANGSGKSTLLHIVGGLDLPDRGGVVFDGQSVFDLPRRTRERLRNTDVGFIFQFYHLLPELNVRENILLPHMVGTSVPRWLAQDCVNALKRSFARVVGTPMLDWAIRKCSKALNRKLGGMVGRMLDTLVPTWSMAQSEARQQTEDIIDKVGLSARARHRPAELSGGERQRAAIARAIVTRPRLLLADEPTGNLDRAMGREILAVLAKLNQQGQTIVMVTHDPQVASLAHRVVQLVDGKIRRSAS